MSQDVATPPAWMEIEALAAARVIYYGNLAIPHERMAQALASTQIRVTASMQYAVAHECKELRDALEHIERTAKASYSQTRRIRWIELRARGALDGTDEWRTVHLPSNRDAASERVRLKHRIRELEAAPVARPIAEYHEDYGNVLWFAWDTDDWLGEPAWIGQPLDSDWPGYHTHWLPHPPFPAPVKQEEVCSICNGAGMYVIDGPTSEADGHHPNLEQCDCRAERAAEHHA